MIYLQKLKNNKSLISNYLITFINTFHPLFILYYVTFEIDLKTYGEIIYYVAWCNIFMVLFDFGLNLCLTSRYRTIHENLILKISSTLLIYRLLFILMLTLIFALFYIFIIESYLIISLMILMIGLLLQVSIPMELYWSLKKIHFYLPVLVIAKVIGITFFYINLSDKNALFIYANHLLIISIMQVFLISITLKIWKHFRRSLKIFSYYKYSVTFFLNKGSSTYVSSVPRILLKSVSDEILYSVYILYDQIYSMIQSLIQPLSMNILGKNKSNTSAKDYSVKIIKSTLIISLIILISGLLSVVGIQSFGSLASLDYFIAYLAVFYIILTSFKICNSIFGLPLHTLLRIQIKSNTDVIIQSLAVLILLYSIYLSNFLTVYLAIFCIILTELFLLMFRLLRVRKSLYEY